MRLESYRDLDAWRVSMDLTRSVFALAARLPHPHRLEIGGQMRRAALSVPSNIAEGYRQCARRAYVRHLRIAAGSLAELETQLAIAIDTRLCLEAEGAALQEMCSRVARMLNVLIRRLAAP